MQELAPARTDHFPVGEIRDKRICVYQEGDGTWFMHVEGRGHIEISQEIAALYVDRHIG